MKPYGEVFAQFYDRYFGDYAERAAPHLLRFFTSLPVAASRLPLLDLGCGTGRLALRFLEAGYPFVGLDQSPHMLVLAENRCWHYVAAHQGRFLQEDISHFQIGDAFSMALSTYNTLNHLDSEEKLRGCFRSVHHCLSKGGLFVFDLHTLAGLREWSSSESAQWGKESLECHGEFDGSQGKATMHLKGVMDGHPFKERISNYAYSLKQVAQWLQAEGFGQVDFRRIDDMENSLESPERENRVMVVAG